MRTCICFSLRPWLAGTYAYFLIINGISLRVQISFHLIFPALRTARETFTGGGGGLVITSETEGHVQAQSQMTGEHGRHPCYEASCMKDPCLWNALMENSQIPLPCEKNLFPKRQTQVGLSLLLRLSTSCPNPITCELLSKSNPVPIGQV